MDIKPKTKSKIIKKRKFANRKDFINTYGESVFEDEEIVKKIHKYWLRKDKTAVFLLKNYLN